MRCFWGWHGRHIRRHRDCIVKRWGRSCAVTCQGVHLVSLRRNCRAACRADMLLRITGGSLSQPGHTNGCDICTLHPIPCTGSTLRCCGSVVLCCSLQSGQTMRPCASLQCMHCMWCCKKYHCNVEWHLHACRTRLLGWLSMCGVCLKYAPCRTPQLTCAAHSMLACIALVV